MSANRIHTTNSANTRRRAQEDFLPVAMRVVWVLIVGSALLTLGFTFYPEWTRLSGMRQDVAAQKARLEELHKLAAEREQEVKLLQTDREYLEMIARDKLDLMKQGETIFRLSSTQHKY
jgi:cell division protein FtsB